jgi:hypothetical protein
MPHELVSFLDDQIEPVLDVPGDGLTRFFRDLVYSQRFGYVLCRDTTGLSSTLYEIGEADEETSED